MRTLPKNEMTADEFIAWSLAQPKDREGGKYELEDGHVIEMQSERALHVEVKARINRLIEDAIRRSRKPCFALGDGVTVRVSKKKVYKPDGLVYCGKRVAPDTVEIPEPVIIVEVLSPDSVSRDHGEKVEAYFSLASVQHYLIIDPDRKALVQHRRGPGDELFTRIRRSGGLKLEPPGIEIAIDDLFEREDEQPA